MTRCRAPIAMPSGVGAGKDKARIGVTPEKVTNTGRGGTPGGVVKSVNTAALGAAGRFRGKKITPLRVRRSSPPFYPNTSLYINRLPLAARMACCVRSPSPSSRWSCRNWNSDKYRCKCLWLTE